MGITVGHVLTATTPDDPLYEIQPQHWNSAHAVTFTPDATEVIKWASAGTESISSGTLVFGNSNGVSFGMSNGTITATVVPGAAAGIAAVQAGTQTQTSGTLVFANSNGITAGMSGSSQVTFSHNGITSQSVQTQNMVSVLGSTGNISFQNGNGITFGANASTITASHNGLTTARASNDAIGLNTAQTNVTWTVNSAGISLNAGAYLTTAARSQDSSNYAGTTTGFAGTNISGSMTHNTAGLNIALSVAAGGGGADGYNILAAGTQTANTTGTVVFQNNAAITFGMSNNSVITATHNGLTTARASNDAIGLNTALTANGVSMTANSAGLSLNFPAFLTTAALSGDTTKYAGISSGTQTTAGTNIVMTHNTAGLNLGVPAYITTAALSQNTSNYAGLGTTFNGANISGSMTMNTAGLQLSMSVAAPGGGGGTAATIFANSNTTQSSSGTMALSSMIFAGAGIASVGVTNGSVVISVPAGGGGGDGYNIVSMLTSTSGGATAGATFSQLSGSIGLMAGSNITLSQTSNTINIVGVGANTLTNWRIMPLGNNTTFSTLGQNSIYLQHFQPEDYLQFSNLELYGRGTFVSSSNSKVYAQTIDYGIYSQGTGASTSQMSLMSSSQILYSASYNSNTAYGFTISQGAGSFTTSSGGTGMVTDLSGAFHNYMPFTASLLPDKKYAFGIRMSSATTAATGAWAWAPLAMTNMTSNMGRIYVSTTQGVNASVIGDREMGVYGTTSAAMPNTYATSQLAIAVSRQNLYLQFDS